jgi:tape measure domain-containing protein
MATDVERLLVRLEASISGYERSMRQALGITSSQTNAIDRQFAKLRKNVESQMAGIGKSVEGALSGLSLRGLQQSLGGLAGVLATNEVLKYADAWKNAQNQLAVAGVVGEQQKQVMEDIFQAAQKTATPFEALVSVYGKAAQVSKELGASQQQLLQFSEGVGTALRVSGTSAAAASGALQQLSQLLGSGVVRAEEFNSVNEGARPILQAVANGLDAAGGSVNKLRQIMIAGNLTSKQFFDAFLKGAPSLQAQLGNATETVAQAFTKVNNAMTKYVGQTDSSLGATQRLIQGLGYLADNFDKVADVSLKVAGIFAGALVGRSIANMVVQFGSAAGAILNFVKAAQAAQTTGGLLAAFGALGSAAGPIGAAIGVAAAGAVLYFGDQAAETAARTDELSAEMEKLGLTGPKAATGIKAVSDETKKLTDGENARLLRQVNIELDRMRGGGVLSGGIFDTAKVKDFVAILTRASDISNTWRGGIFGGEAAAPGDEAAIARVREITTALQTNQTTVAQVLPQINELARTDISKPVQDLVAQLKESATWWQNNIALQAQSGTASAVYQQQADQLGNLITQLELYAGTIKNAAGERVVSPEQLDQLRDIADRLRNGENVAEEARAKLEELGRVSPSFGPLLASIGTAIGGLLNLQNAARNAMAAIAGVQGKGTTSDAASNTAAEQAAAVQANATRAYLAEQTRINNLSKDQLRYEKELAETKKNAAQSQIVLTDEQARATTQQRIAAEDARKAEGKKGRGGGSSRTKLSGDDKVALDADKYAAETAQIHLNTQAIGLNAYEKTKLLETHKLEAEQLEKLRRAKGLDAQLSDEQKKKIAELVEARAKEVQANEEAEKSLERLKEFESGIADLGFDFFSGLIDGSKSFKESIDDLIKSLAKMILQAALLGTGPLGGLFGGLGQSKGGVGGLFGSLFSLFGMSEGGFTGPGGKYTPKGIVHAGEYVLDAETTKKIGVKNLDMLRQGMRGYTDGGLVGRMQTVAPGAYGTMGNTGNMSFAFAIDARGATRDSVPILEQQIQKLRRDIPSIVLNAQKRGTL